jgi:molybdopterin-containing oxidoreductase family iron-sulfur binding subunit
MVYNRCVGTRYCANNCPYSARRFNFHSYRWPESFNMMLNPDVTPRDMGVMEKCTFCVQRIRSFKDSKRDQYGLAAASRIQPEDDSRLQKLTACAQACPSDAIVFGNLKDEESAVAKSFSEPRSYRMLEELNNKPGVTYLARIVHTSSELHGHESHGDSHGDHGDGHGHDHESKENNHH